MPSKVPLVDLRMITAGLVLDVLREISRANFGSDSYVQRAPETVLLCALLVATGNGKSMNVSQLAEITSMPRATIYRRVRIMERLGVAFIDPSGNIVLSIAKAGDPRIKISQKRIAGYVHRASKRLSEMDS